jgi:penicillin-binding protein 2
VKNTQAPRGDIFDRNGKLLATSRMVPSVVVDRTFVETAQRETLLRRLAALLGLDYGAIDEKYEKAGINGRFTVGVVSLDVAFKINESLDEFPGVEIVMVPERVYLSGPTAAHLIGHLGLPDAEDLDANPDLNPDVRIGQLGVERSYEDDLSGTEGVIEYRTRRGAIVEQSPPIEPIQGDSLILTIDLDLQQVAEFAVEEGIKLSNQVKDTDRAAGEEVFGVTERGAAVVLDAKTFEVLAAASVPDFDPQLFVAGLDQAKFDELNEERAFVNLAVNGQYPPASTFKAITYTVISEENLPFPTDIEGVDSENRLVHCDGKLELPNLADGSPQVKNDWYVPADLGWKDIHGALQQSCNIFFWSAALGTWQAYKGQDRENIIQDWAMDLGYGAQTGIDLPGEATGVVPTRQLFEQWAEYQRENPDELPRLHPSRLEESSPWFGGDLMDFAIGQGAFTATPLQVAVSYAALVNGGTVMEPRVVSQVIDSEGRLVREVDSRLVRQVQIGSDTRLSLIADLGGVVSQGTAERAFEDFGPGLEQIGGKTGTGQISKNKDNHAWFVGVAPLNDPQYIVVVVIDEGGSGGGIAAPVARYILQYLMGNEPTPIVAGEKAD